MTRESYFRSRIIPTHDSTRHMASSVPFQLTEDDVRRGQLESEDVGSWCLLVRGCYHLFSNETLARRAYDMLLEGEMVR